jgi:hypothetical protein
MSFLEIFEPGLKNVREENDRQKMLVVRPSHGGGAPLGIDLDAGTATFGVMPPEDALDSDGAPDSGNAGADGAAVPGSAA